MVEAIEPTTTTNRQAKGRLTVALDACSSTGLSIEVTLGLGSVKFEGAIHRSAEFHIACE